MPISRIKSSAISDGTVTSADLATNIDIAGTLDVTGATTLDSGLTVDANGATVLTVDLATSDGTVIDVQKNGATVGSIGTFGGQLDISGTTNGIRFGGQLEPLVSRTRTNNAVDLGSSTYGFKNLYLSSGVVFGTTGGVVTSKTLDDYETGTWDPYWGGTSDPTASYTNQNGWYVKIGKLVWCGGVIQTSSTSGGSGNLLIRGLPFNSASDQANEVSTMSVGYSNGFSTYYPTAGYMGRNRTFVNVSTVDQSNGTALIQVSYLTTTSYLNFNITYTTD
jgi:hypothetical protein